MHKLLSNAKPPISKANIGSKTSKVSHPYLYHCHEKYQDLFENENLIFVLTYTAKLIASITQTRHFLLLFCLPFIACK